MYIYKLPTILLLLLFQVAVVAQEDSLSMTSIESGYQQALLANKEYKPLESNELLADVVAKYQHLENWPKVITSLHLYASNFIQLNDFESVDSILYLCEDLIESHNIDDVNVAIESYFLFGATFHEKGLYQKSLNAFNDALELLVGSKNLTKTDSLVTNKFKEEYETNLAIGHLYNYAAFPLFAMGRSDEGVEYFKAANFFYEKSKDLQSIYGSYINLGKGYASIGSYETAKAWLAKIIEKFEGKDDGVLFLATAYSQLINISKSEQDFIKEAGLLEKQYKLFFKPDMLKLEGLTGTSLDVAYCTHLAHRSLNEANLGNCDQSNKWAQQCLDTLLNISKDVEIKASVLFRLGEGRIACNDQDAGIFYLDKGLEIIDNDVRAYKDIDQEKFLSNQRIELLNLKAKVFLDRGSVHGDQQILQLEEGLKYAYQSVNLLEGLRLGLVQSDIDNLSREKSLLELDSKYKGSFALAIELNYKLYDLTKDRKYLEKAFVYTEKSKAFALRQGMSRLEKMQGLSEENRATLFQMESKIFYYEKKIGEAIGPEFNQLRERLYQQYLQLKETYKKSLSNISNEGNAQRVFQDIYQKDVAEIIDLEEYSKVNKLAFLTFFSHSNSLFVFKTHNGSTTLEKLNLSDSWEGDIDFVQAAYQDLDLTVNVKHAERFIHLHEKWYDLFLGGISNDINRYCIIPDQAVFGINFNLLIKGKNKISTIQLPGTSYEIVDFSVPDYLLKSKSTFEVHSGTIFLNEKISEIKKEKQPRPLDIIGFSPRYELRNKFKNLAKGYIPLRELSLELKNVLPLFSESKKEHYQGSAATVQNLLDNAISRSKVLHISAHGIINEKDPYLSYLAMAYSEESKNQTDEDLDLGEIFNLNINSDLAVISSCNSGTSRLVRGNAKINFARAFRYANCPGIIMGLWSIDDQSTASIFAHFYKELLNGKRGDQSLSIAQKQYLADKKNAFLDKRLSVDQKEQLLIEMHPYFWAGLAALGIFESMKF